MNFEKYEFNGFIGIFENYFKNAYLDELVNYYDSMSKLSLHYRDDIPKHRKDDEQLFLLNHNVINTVNPKNINHFLEVLWEKIFPIYTEKFSILQDVSYKVDQIKMKKIAPGEGFHQWHYESLYENSRRKIVIQMYMNNIDEAGETEFLYQNTRVVPKKNKLLIWPADWTHTHRGNPPIGATDKYILTTWLIEIDDENKGRR
jgi:hypothetical protein